MTALSPPLHQAAKEAKANDSKSCVADPEVPVPLLAVRRLRLASRAVLGHVLGFISTIK